MKTGRDILEYLSTCSEFELDLPVVVDVRDHSSVGQYDVEAIGVATVPPNRMAIGLAT